MGDREDLMALRRLAELEAKASGGAAAVPTPKAPAAEQESPYSFMNLAGAAIEPNLALASGAIAAPISGFAGMLGGMLPGPQGQSADWVRATQGALTYMPQTEGGKTATGAISAPFELYGKGTNAIGEKVAELSGSPALGAYVKTGYDVVGPMALARGLRMPHAADTAQGQAAQWLMRKAVKPSPTLPRAQTDRAIVSMLDEGISQTQGGMDKARSIVETLHPQGEALIANSPATVNVVRSAAPMRRVYDRATTQSRADMDAVRGVWDDFRNLPGVRGQTDIPVQLAHQLKRGQQNIARDAYNQQGTSAMEARKALAAGLREQEAQAVPGLSPILRREADMMNVLEVADPRAQAAANNNPLGLTPLGGSKTGAAAFALDRSAAIKSYLARALYGLGNPDAARTAIGTGTTARTQELEQ